MMKKRIMVIGPRNSGKSELVSYLEKREISSFPGNIVYYEQTIHVPSSYIECPWMFKHIIAAQQTAYLAVMMLGTGKKKNTYPPHCVSSLLIPVFGVVSVDVKKAENAQAIQACQKELKDAGVARRFIVDFSNENSLQPLMSAIKTLDKESQNE
ncbi:EutP/PduV family microcompartment system protein [Lactovum odontotermitis]